MITVDMVERLVPEGIRVRSVPGGFILSDGQWTAPLSAEGLPVPDAAQVQGPLAERIDQAILSLKSARQGDDHALNADRAAG